MVFALLSYQSPVFTALHLLLIVNLNETMANVFNSIVLHADQLMQTLIMALFISYSFAIFNVIYFRDTFLSGISRNGEVQICRNLISCFLHGTDLGLRYGGGVGEQQNIIEYGDPLFVGKIIFNYLYYVLMQIIFLNVVFGIIIDTFAELRDQKTDKGEYFLVFPEVKSS